MGPVLAREVPRNMKAALLLLSTCAALFAASPVADIKLDQAGYLPHAPKVAIVASTAPAAAFLVKREGDGKVVYTGKLGAAVSDPDSGDRVQSADFSALHQSGRYYLEVPGVGRSWSFAIDANVYSRAYYLAMRSYYGQRCGTAVDLGSEFPGYKHAACHLDGAYHATAGRSGAKADAGGKGWHDAGDYGRYVVNSGITTGTLLWTYELFPKRIGAVGLKLPESGNGTPDILNEIRWNLDWMLSMQDADGGVWHKQTSEQFCGFIMPEDDHLTSYVIGTGSAPYKSSCATADLAAVAAIAARVFRPFDAAYADRALRAAGLAWGWLEKNPNVLFRNPRGIGTGGYGDNSCADERLWAAAELWRTTHDADYEKYFLANYAAFLKNIGPAGAPEGWNMLAGPALWGYALDPRANAAAAAAIRQQMIAAADAIVERTAANGYRVSLLSRDYVWGSNGVAANYGLQLLVTNRIKPDERYVDAALDNLHYLLGRNTLSLSFVTQVGANPFRHPHHRLSAADGLAEPWPGLLSGGPNRGRQDAAMQKLPAGLPPAKCYLDQQESYASNEVAINWNAPLVFLLAGVVPEQ
jgi:endoglucanase